MSTKYKIKKEVWGRKGLHLTCYRGIYEDPKEARDKMFEMNWSDMKSIPRYCEVIAERYWFPLFGDIGYGYDFEVYQKGRPTYEEADIHVIYSIEEA